MSLIELVHLRKQFGQLVAVDDITLSIEEGKITGLIGPNGSGKTTLFNLISGFIRPTRGNIIWQGRDITGQSPHTRVKEGVARTFQLTSLLKEITVLQNIIMACHLHTGIGLFEQFLRTARIRKIEEAVEKKALEFLQTMSIAHLKDEIAGELPHGYQRFLGVAIALASEPKLLLLDEPATGMTPVEREEMMDKIEMLRDRGITIILVEHSMKAIMSTCEKIIVMNFGRKIAEGSCEEISKNKDVIEAYLGAETYAAA